MIGHGLRDQAFHGKFRINNRLRIEETNDDISWLHFKSLPLNLSIELLHTSVTLFAEHMNTPTTTSNHMSLLSLVIMG